MSGDDDLDVYRPAHGPDRVTAATWTVRILGVLVGAGVSLYGVALFALRCFDTCPADPSLDKIAQLLAGAVVLFGLTVVVASASAGTGSVPAALAVSVLGALVALAGVAALLLVPTIDAPGDHSGTTKAGVVAVLVGSLVAGVGFWRLPSGPRSAD